MPRRARDGGRTSITRAAPQPMSLNARRSAAGRGGASARGSSLEVTCGSGECREAMAGIAVDQAILDVRFSFRAPSEAPGFDWSR